MLTVEDAWFEGRVVADAPTCARCGTYCRPDALDARACCEACVAVLDTGQRRREAISIAMKLALGPAFVAIATLWSFAHQREVPIIFAVWLVPLACAYLLVRTERPGVAWVGALASVGMIAWLLASLVYTEQVERLIDVVMLSIAPLVALPGCVRLTRLVERLRFVAR